MSEKKLGKITKVEYGFNSDGFFGLQLTFNMSGSCIDMGYTVDLSKDELWTEHKASMRNNLIIEHTYFISNLLKDAKVRDIHQLKGKPVEVEIEKRCFKNFRILTEVL